MIGGIDLMIESLVFRRLKAGIKNILGEILIFRNMMITKKKKKLTEKWMNHNFFIEIQEDFSQKIYNSGKEINTILTDLKNLQKKEVNH